MLKTELVALSSRCHHSERFCAKPNQAKLQDRRRCGPGKSKGQTTGCCGTLSSLANAEKTELVALSSRCHHSGRFCDKPNQANLQTQRRCGPGKK
ncbi:hypothetical protein BaRGS_00010438 [Batillaria attramentaria]|uniref:Uncharacterized protein n=1 Tax=Batillaria attramentaria TaxID=370345 RepID=A0ABD0LG10_9CAEN